MLRLCALSPLYVFNRLKGPRAHLGHTHREHRGVGIAPCRTTYHAALRIDDANTAHTTRALLGEIGSISASFFLFWPKFLFFIISLFTNCCWCEISIFIMRKSSMAVSELSVVFPGSSWKIDKNWDQISIDNFKEAIKIKLYENFHFKGTCSYSILSSQHGWCLLQEFQFKIQIHCSIFPIHRSIDIRMSLIFNKINKFFTIILLHLIYILF